MVEGMAGPRMVYYRADVLYHSDQPGGGLVDDKKKKKNQNRRERREAR